MNVFHRTVENSYGLTFYVEKLPPTISRLQPHYLQGHNRNVAKVGFIGLGVMGLPMASHLHQSQMLHAVWNRTANKADSFRGTDVQVANTVGELANDCEIIILCVSRSEDVTSLVEQCLQSAKPGTLFVDHSTIEPKAAQAIGEACVQKGCSFMDCPVTGGSMGAQAGTLTVFCGGTEADLERARPFLSSYSKRVERVGPVGSGSLMKLANQIAVASSVAGLCESMAFAEKAGLDVAQALSLIGSGAGGSWSFQNYGPRMIQRNFDPGFSIQNQIKDLEYCEKASKGLGATIEAASLFLHKLKAMQEEGFGDRATHALFAQLLGEIPRREP